MTFPLDLHKLNPCIPLCESPPYHGGGFSVSQRSQRLSCLGAFGPWKGLPFLGETPRQRAIPTNLMRGRSREQHKLQGIELLWPLNSGLGRVLNPVPARCPGLSLRGRAESSLKRRHGPALLQEALFGLGAVCVERVEALASNRDMEYHLFGGEGASL